MAPSFGGGMIVPYTPMQQQQLLDRGVSMEQLQPYSPKSGRTVSMQQLQPVSLAGGFSGRRFSGNSGAGLGVSQPVAMRSAGAGLGVSQPVARRSAAYGVGKLSQAPALENRSSVKQMQVEVAANYAAMRGAHTGDPLARREAAAEALWRVQDEDLARRLAMLENVLRRSTDMPTQDIPAASRVHVEQAREQQVESQQFHAKSEAHKQAFATYHEGPFMLAQTPDGEEVGVQAVKGRDMQEDGYFVDPKLAEAQAERDRAEKELTKQYR